MVFFIDDVSVGGCFGFRWGVAEILSVGERVFVAGGGVGG